MEIAQDSNQGLGEIPASVPSFPENPYHRLIKGYKLLSASRNDPVADAKLSMLLFEDELAAFLFLKQRFRLPRQKIFS